ncbi:MAG: hypothetical protein ACRDY1_05130 [Acidimicrobiales bacterium]
MSRYFLPVAAGACLVGGLMVANPLVASAKKVCTNPTGCGSIKVAPKTVTASSTATTVTVKGKGFTPGDSSVNVLECASAAVAENSCDLSTVTPVPLVGPKGTFTVTMNFLSDTYSDTNHDSCVPTGKTTKACGVAAGNQAMTDDAGIVAVTIKAPKVSKH